jgi:hypothetical protein
MHISCVYVWHVSSVPDVVCCMCFILMLHIHAYCKYIFHAFLGVSCVYLQVFYLHIAYVYNGFQMFSDVFASVSYTCFKCLICLFSYVTIVASECFKSRSGVARGDVRGKQLAARATFQTAWVTFSVARATSGVAWAHCWCAHDPDALCACSLPVRAPSTG